MSEHDPIDAPFGLLEDADNIPSDNLDHGFEPEEPPHDEREAARAKGWTTRTIVVATFVLALLNAKSVQTWATTLPPEWGGEAIRALADGWYERTAEAGLDRPRAAVHDAYEAKKDLTWNDLGGGR